MTTTLCLSGAVVLKAGVNAPTLTEAQYTSLINQAENFIAVQSRYNFVSNWLSISGSALAYFLEDIASSHAAISVINSDMSGFTSKEEAQTMLDVNYSKVVDGINLLRDDKFRKFVIEGVVD